MNESKIAWELISIFFVFQGVLASAAALMYTQEITDLRPYLVLFLMASVSSFLWFMMQYRAKLWRESWLLLGLKVERELKQSGLVSNPDWHIFGLEQKIRDEKLVLELFKPTNEIRFRHQRCFEKVGALRIAHGSMLALGFIWAVFFISTFLKLLSLL
jgi:hypothetical protein